MKICVSYPVDVCYVIIYAKKSRVNQNIEMLLMPPGQSRGTPMKICVSYPVDVCYVIIYAKKSRVNQNIEMLLMPPFFCQLFRLLFSPAQNLDSDCPCPLCLIPVPKKIPMCFLSKLAN